jgi:diguanylate cyclase (GGDEF)-like protein/putative nucleotidyltransferase with HDIG domain
MALLRNGRETEEHARLLGDAQARIAALERQLEVQAGFDPVTGLVSLPRFRAQLDIEVQRSRRHGRPLSAAVLDIDGFRDINSRHGYAIGDTVLAAVGTVLTNATRIHDFACRTSADEFVVVMPETDIPGAERAFERIMLELEAAEAGPVSHISASVGIAIFEHTQSSPQLIAAAVTGLERARAAGGTRVAVGNAEAASQDEAQRDAVAGLAVALLERDRYTGEHSESVVELAGAVGRGLGLAEDEVDRVRAGALLHDIGKVAIPDDILHKPGPLDEAQWKVMRDHPVIGERILRAIPGLGGIARIVRHEHERWDGGGYPDGISGESIPIGARIILACDAYHAMTSDRPYRAAMTHAEALAELQRNAGTQFDPAVVEALVGALYGSRQAGARAEQHRAPIHPAASAA